MARIINGVVPERPEFEVTVSADEGVRVVAVSRELDIATMVEFGAALTTTPGRGHNQSSTSPAEPSSTPRASGGESGRRAPRRRPAGGWLWPASIQRISQMTALDTVLEWVDNPGDGAGTPLRRAGYGQGPNVAAPGGSTLIAAVCLSWHHLHGVGGPANRRLSLRFVAKGVLPARARTGFAIRARGCRTCSGARTRNHHTRLRLCRCARRL